MKNRKAFEFGIGLLIGGGVACVLGLHIISFVLSYWGVAFSVVGWFCEPRRE